MSPSSSDVGAPVAARRRAGLDHVTSVSAGEIVGVAGVEGNGQAELINASCSAWEPRRRIDPARMAPTPPGSDAAAQRHAGVAYIPEDRQREGLLLDAPLWENASWATSARRPISRARGSRRAGARGATARIIEGPTSGHRRRRRSVCAVGGNQQKLIVGRELAGSPRLLIAAHPTRGMDVGAQAEIWARLGRARDEGLAVLLVSSDLGELIALADRVVVILRGRLVAEFEGGRVSLEALGAAMTGATPA